MSMPSEISEIIELGGNHVVNAVKDALNVEIIPAEWERARRRDTL